MANRPSLLASIMKPNVYLCLVLHNHQPVGNFDDVFEAAYQDSYLPFLEVFEPYEALRLSLHTSGPLMMWLAQRHPEYIQRVRNLVELDRLEIIGGPQYEPILTMLPKRDQVGQILAYSDWLRQHLAAQVHGMWTPERVWESNLTSAVTTAGIQYTVLDDYHFRAAGVMPDQMHGYFLTEDDGHILRIFPGSERLRYTIPFCPADETVAYCREIAEQYPGSVLTFGDDGEKFGTWPDTKAHVYDQGWLKSFFDSLTANRDWLHTATLAEAVDKTSPRGRIYLPDCSYREMTEWSLPVQRQEQLEHAIHDFENDPRWQQLQVFVRGGYWRNFKVKYEEAHEMYARMMEVSRRVSESDNTARHHHDWSSLVDHLYRGQCNCPYWHGAFGGIYLPHLRNAIYSHLIQADNLLQKITREDDAPWVEAVADDFNFDGQQEVRLANDQLIAYAAPGLGGRLYELDLRGIAHNLLATMQRRPEAYHRKVLAGPNTDADQVASIHDRVVFKQAGLNERLQYDRFPRKSLMDHFYDEDASLACVMSGKAQERGDFIDLPFDAKLRRGSDRVQLQMQRHGNAWGIPLTITKAVTLVAGSGTLEFAYLLEELPENQTFHFGVEFNFAGLPAGADDRYFIDQQNHNLGQLGTPIDLQAVNSLGLVDQWLGVEVSLATDRDTDFWAFPIETVSQSEGGFELVHQSVCVQPHWKVTADVNGRWAVRIVLRTRLLHAAEPQQVELKLAANP